MNKETVEFYIDLNVQEKTRLRAGKTQVVLEAMGIRPEDFFFSGKVDKDNIDLYFFSPKAIIHAIDFRTKHDFDVMTIDAISRIQILTNEESGNLTPTDGEITITILTNTGCEIKMQAFNRNCEKLKMLIRKYIFPVTAA